MKDQDYRLVARACSFRNIVLSLTLSTFKYSNILVILYERVYACINSYGTIPFDLEHMRLPIERSNKVPKKMIGCEAEGVFSAGAHF